MTIKDGPEVFLRAYAVGRNTQPFVAACAERSWMNATPDRYAYRCLPLMSANTYGWQLLLPCDVLADWNGGVGIDDLIVSCKHKRQANSNFGCGIVTFEVGYVFTTPPGCHLIVTGPLNTFKDGAAPMTGLIETDWMSSTFTVNYKMTRPGQVSWSAGEAFAQIFMVPAGFQEQVVPAVHRMSDNPALKMEYTAWRDKRNEAVQLMKEKVVGVPSWDKDYFLGRYADGRQTSTNHKVKARSSDPVDHRDAHD